MNFIGRRKKKNYWKNTPSDFIFPIIIKMEKSTKNNKSHYWIFK
jgi:hypothetical protein